MSDMESAQASAILLLVFIFIITWEKLLLTSMDDTRQVSLLVGTYINLVLYGHISLPGLSVSHDVQVVSLRRVYSYIISQC